MKPTILCRNCKAPRENIEYKCRKCGGTFFVKIHWKYSENLRKNFPYINKWIIEPEFNTPILKFDNLSMKLDYFTPTLSYKDRGMLNLFSSIKCNENLPSGSQVNEDSSGNALIMKGIYTEYSSATTLAAYEKTDKSKNSLLILTGSGIKNI